MVDNSTKSVLSCTRNQLITPAPRGDQGLEIKMINTIRIHFDANTVVVFSDQANKHYLQDAKQKLAELGERVTSIEQEVWYSERKIKSCKVVKSI